MSASADLPRATAGASDLARFWTLDPSIDFLNHGSFGACPRPVLEVQERLRARLESEPVRFFLRELPGLLDEARLQLSAFLGADPEGLAFVSNATSGVNTVLASLALEPGSELLTTDHAYGACRNALEHVARRSGAQVARVSVPFPIEDPGQVVAAVLAGITPRTRLALLDHVTSPTGLVFPVADLVRALERRGVETLVDGAHAPGMLPLALDDLAPSYYTGNCHKWLCAPKGAAFLWVRHDRRAAVRPLVISHGASSPEGPRSRFRLEFDWGGTDDPTAWLAVPDAIRFLDRLHPGGVGELMARNRALAIEARATLASALGVELPCPDEMIGTLAALPLPAGGERAPRSVLERDPLQDLLFEHHRIEVPVMAWPAPPSRLLRISAQAYNRPEQYRRLAAALGAALGR